MSFASQFSAPYLDFHCHGVKSNEADVLSLISLRPSEYPFGLKNSSLNKFSIGLHPYFAEDMRTEALAFLEEVLSHERASFWALGEVGLDKRSAISLDIQEDFLLKQIALSESYRLPLVLHVVKCWDELIRIKQSVPSSQPWIIHGFRGKVEQAKSLINLGFYLSCSAYCPTESFSLAYERKRAFLETDDYELSIKEVYTYFSEKLGLSLENLREEIFQSLGTLF